MSSVEGVYEMVKAVHYAMALNAITLLASACALPLVPQAFIEPVATWTGIGLACAIGAKFAFRLLLPYLASASTQTETQERWEAAHWKQRTMGVMGIVFYLASVLSFFWGLATTFFLQVDK